MMSKFSIAIDLDEIRGSSLKKIPLAANLEGQITKNAALF
jgi:hypothetical protein